MRHEAAGSGGPHRRLPVTRPIGRIVGLKPVGPDDYIVAVEDVRDERVHVGRKPLDFEPWLKSVKEGRYALPPFGLYGRCGEIHCDRDLDVEIFRTCIPSQADLVELAARTPPRKNGGLTEQLEAVRDVQDREPVAPDLLAPTIIDATADFRVEKLPRLVVHHDVPRESVE